MTQEEQQYYDALVQAGIKMGKRKNSGFTRVLCYIDGELCDLPPAQSIKGMKSRLRTWLTWQVFYMRRAKTMNHLDIKLSRVLMTRWITDHCTFKEVEIK